MLCARTRRAVAVTTFGGWLRGYLVLQQRVRQQLLQPRVSISSSFSRLASETLMPRTCSARGSSSLPRTRACGRGPSPPSPHRPPGDLRFRESLLHRPTFRLGRTLNRNATQNGEDVNAVARMGEGTRGRSRPNTHPCPGRLRVEIWPPFTSGPHRLKRRPRPRPLRPALRRSKG